MKLVILYGSVVAFNILVLAGTVYIDLFSKWKEPMIYKNVLKIYERLILKSVGKLMVNYKVIVHNILHVLMNKIQVM